LKGIFSVEKFRFFTFQMIQPLTEFGVKNEKMRKYTKNLRVDGAI
jgi:hypothetical protein